MDGSTRLANGSTDAVQRYEYGRLEIFARGFWSNVCNNNRFTPDSAKVACRALGYDGGVALRFTQAYANSRSQVGSAGYCLVPVGTQLYYVHMQGKLQSTLRLSAA